MKTFKKIAILGGGPSALFIFKRLVESERTDISIEIFEKSDKLGSGMPYSKAGANDEHITNVSGNEIPDLVTSVNDWIQTLPADLLTRFRINPDKFNDYKVMPRLLFGKYLTAQFDLLKNQAALSGILVETYLGKEVTDIIDYPEQNKVRVKLADQSEFEYDNVIICTGHRWPKKFEGKIPGYFDSPYPPSKLEFKVNHRVAIKGSSLTAIDGIRTLARHNGEFKLDQNDKLLFEPAPGSEDFKIVMHSRNGMLPAIRFHLEDPHLLKDSILSKAEVAQNKAENDGFLALDFVFEKNFKEMFKEKRPEFYAIIKDLSMEDFVTIVMNKRERYEPFQLFKTEYFEAEESIKKEESVYWKELLAVLSFAMNYPAKYFSAEDMLRLQKTLMPLISIVIAFVPQSSVEEILALNEAGVLEIVSVGEDGAEEAQPEGGAIYHYTDEDGQRQSNQYDTFIDCVGQPHLSYQDLPYPSLISKKTVSPAKIKFKDNKAGMEASKTNDKVEKGIDGCYYLNVPGITINDNFQVINNYNALNDRIYMMAVPYIGGYNPDYSGLDFCEAASERIVNALLKTN
ncbi:FAD/NAD(P)-binding protein [Pedobacter rhodius]|uniref:FAD/NAD(P)-binding protein n=1 Tax=Pedobacter rhodius TaxID=3004098 RepID=A0ABT4KZ92_9SPHI|nr:FAD/NAD(P)-binding protein [Pedobacter sp. SJ11]MCZ4224239.1 FAD/NAD(P)-binding protein [Pedobacter sp. SJ11]